QGGAGRAARTAGRTAAGRRVKEGAVARPEAQGDGGRDDWLSLLDEALARLPEKYRLPLVLCDLEGRTRREAAESLGWPEGTVAGRVARARTLLARRPTRRGGGAAGGAPGGGGSPGGGAGGAPGAPGASPRAGAAGGGGRGG